MHLTSPLLIEAALEAVYSLHAKNLPPHVKIKEKTALFRVFDVFTPYELVEPGLL